jgi:hypothetical protein
MLLPGDFALGDLTRRYLISQVEALIRNIERNKNHAMFVVPGPSS